MKCLHRKGSKKNDQVVIKICAKTVLKQVREKDKKCRMKLGESPGKHPPWEKTSLWRIALLRAFKNV